VSRVAKAKSQARIQHRPDSDMDVIFAVSGDPSKSTFYPKLIKVMKANLTNGKVYPGRSNNVVHIDFAKGGKFELVLLSERDFDIQHGDDVKYRRVNL
jgi:hypothetical protein